MSAKHSWTMKSLFAVLLHRVLRPWRKARRKARPVVEPLEQRQAPAVFTLSTAVADGAAGSLRDAVITANANADASNTFNLAAGTFTLTIANSGGPENAAAEGDLDLTKAKSYIFNGQGSHATFIDGNFLDRVFHVLNPGATVQFNNLTINNGRALDAGTGDNTDAVGGGLLINGGGVTLTNVVVKDNSADALADHSARGGGIALTGGTLNLNSVTFEANAAIGGIGMSGVSGLDGHDGGRGQGGGLYLGSGTVTIASSVFRDNVAKGGDGGNAGSTSLGAVASAGNGGAGQGGGIYQNAGILTLSSTAVVDNLAHGGNGGSVSGSGAFGSSPSGGDGGAGQGGGLYLHGGTLTIRRSEVAENEAVAGEGGHGFLDGDPGSARGGGVFGENGVLKITNSTLAANEAKAAPGTNDAQGGGLFFGVGIGELTNVTVAFNSAGSGQGGGVAIDFDLTVRNSIIADNTAAANPDVLSDDTGDDFLLAASLIENPTGAKVTNQGDNILGVDPGLTALTGNGGPTRTIAFTAASAAFNHGRNSFVAAPTFDGPPFFDQRGNPFARISGGTVDMGAYEVVVPSAPLPAPQGGAANGVSVSLRKVKRGRKKKLALWVMNGGSLKQEIVSPYQSPAYKQIGLELLDTNHDGIIDAVLLSGKKGKKIQSRIIAV